MFFCSFQALSRHDVAQVLDKTLLDEDVCENTIGTLAGAGLGVALNPISAFVEDAATSVILMIGSKATRKWQFLKRFFLPFLANELFSNHITEKEDQTLGFYEAVVSISAFEVQDEVVTDLFRPSSRGLSVSFSSTDGIAIQGLQKVHSFSLKILFCFLFAIISYQYFIFHFPTAI